MIITSLNIGSGSLLKKPIVAIEQDVHSIQSELASLTSVHVGPRDEVQTTVTHGVVEISAAVKLKGLLFRLPPPPDNGNPRQDKA